MKRTVWFSPFLLAAMLSPATLVSDCDPTPVPIPSLSSLEVEADGLDRVVGFDGHTTTYSAWTTDGVTMVTLRALAIEPGALVDYTQFTDVVTYGSLGIGGGEVLLTVPVGPSSVRVDLSNGGAVRRYTVNINPTCTLGSCNDANGCTDDVCDAGISTCEFNDILDGTQCDFSDVGDGLCGAGFCEDACGNGIIDLPAGEFCDDGGDSVLCNGNEEGNPAGCQASACGDGYLNTAAGEDCDDGNLVDNDGCQSTCSITGFCDTDPIVCEGVHDCLTDGICDQSCDPATSCDRCLGQGDPVPVGTECEIGFQGIEGQVCAANTRCVVCLNSQNRGHCLGGSNAGAVCDPNTVPSECPGGNCNTGPSNVYDNPHCPDPDSTDAECVLRAYCGSGDCQPAELAPNGTACGMAGSCDAGVCVDPAP